jgi:hypothetical protein
LRVLEEFCRERLFVERGCIDCAGDDAQDGITKECSGWLSTREDKIANAQLKIHICTNALINPLIAAAEDDEVRPRGKVTNARLAQTLATGIKQENETFGGAEFFYCLDKWLWTHQHAGPAAIGLVVHGAVFPNPPSPQVVILNLRKASLNCACRDARV